MNKKHEQLKKILFDKINKRGLRNIDLSPEIFDYIMTEHDKDRICFSKYSIDTRYPHLVPTKSELDDNGNEVQKTDWSDDVKSNKEFNIVSWSRLNRNEGNQYTIDMMFKENKSVVENLRELDKQVEMFLKTYKCWIVRPTFWNDKGNKWADTWYSLPEFIRNAFSQHGSTEGVFNSILFKNIKNYTYSPSTLIQTDILFKIPEQTLKYRVNGGFRKILLNPYYVRWGKNNAFTIYELKKDYIGRDILVRARHPHVSNGNYCAGGWSQEWDVNTAKGRIFSIAAGFSQFLRRYNSGSPYTEAFYFKRNYTKNISMDETFEHTFSSSREAYEFRTFRTSKFDEENNKVLKFCKRNSLDYTQFHSIWNILRVYKQAFSSKSSMVKFKVHQEPTLKEGPSLTQFNSQPNPMLNCTEVHSVERICDDLISKMKSAIKWPTPFDDPHHVPYVDSSARWKLMERYYPSVVKSRAKILRQIATLMPHSNKFDISFKEILDVKRNKITPEQFINSTLKSVDNQMKTEHFNKLCNDVTVLSKRIKVCILRAIIKENQKKMRKLTNEFKHIKENATENNILLTKIPLEGMERTGFLQAQP